MEKFSDKIFENKDSNMVEVKSDRWGDKYVDSVVCIPIRAYLYGNDQFIEKDGKESKYIDIDQAKELVSEQLERLSGSNDGSELLMNISSEQISFK